jgi:hypothetical protein
MSKEVYLKGEDRLRAISIIKTGLSVKMKPSTILEQLKSKGIDISARTYRRLKLEIYKDGGESIAEIYQKQIGGNLFDQILSFEEMERQCWKLFFDSKTSQEKLRAITQMRMISQDKLKLRKHFPISSRHEEIDYTQIKDDLKEFADEGDSETP